MSKEMDTYTLCLVNCFIPHGEIERQSREAKVKTGRESTSKIKNGQFAKYATSALEAGAVWTIKTYGRQNLWKRIGLARTADPHKSIQMKFIHLTTNYSSRFNRK